jgi:hypothetical protein
MYIDPDLDLIGITNAESRMMKHFKLFGAMMVAYWLPYAYVMRFVGLGRKGHRNFFSHFPGISTAIRLGWILVIPIGLTIYYNFTPPYHAILGLVGVWAGLTFADTLHYIMDVAQ